MTIKFMSVVNAIQSELSDQYIPGAINWADETKGGAWSNAMDDFEKVILSAPPDYALQEAANKYRDRILSLIREYKQTREYDEARELIRRMSE